MTPYSLKNVKAGALDLIMTSEKDAYKQFGTIWMLACTGNYFTASVVYDTVLECSKPSCSR